MSINKNIASVDLGSSKVRCVLARVQDEKNLEIIGVGIAPSNGIRRGSITDMEQSIRAVGAALEDAERMSGEVIHSVTLNFSGTSIRSDDSKGIISVRGEEITEADVDRVLEAARAVSLPKNYDILRIISKAFRIDDEGYVKYPVGMSGIRLEAQTHLIMGQVSSIKNAEKCLERAGVDIKEIIPTHLSASESVLDNRDKDNGVAVVEIGAASTNVTVFEEGTVVYSMVIPIGGGHVTNDLAIGTRCSLDTAEKLKIEHGSCLESDMTDVGGLIDLSQISTDDLHTVSRAEIAQIIFARYQEIFHIVQENLSTVGKAGNLPSGIVLVGGAVKTPGVIEIAKNTLEVSVRIGFPKNISGLVDKVQDPSYASAIGALHFLLRYGNPVSKNISFDIGSFFSSFFSIFKK